VAGPSTLPYAELAGRDGKAGQAAGSGWSAGQRAWFVATVSLVLAGTAVYSRVLTVDSFYDLYTGRYILAHGLPHQNAATVASHGAPWADQQWLAHVSYYAAWLLGGYPAVAALSVALATAGYAVLAHTMLRLAVPPSRAFAWTAVAFLVCLGNYQIQAQNFGYPLLALTLLLLLEDSRVARLRARTWLVLPVLVLWANLHGSVLLGASLTAGYAAWQAARALARRDRGQLAGYLALGGAALAAVLCTPYGTGVIGYYRHFVGNPVLSAHLAEWAPPAPRSPFTWIFIAAVLAVSAAIAVAWRRGARPDPLLAVAAGTALALALMASRNEDWFGLTGSLLAAEALARADRDRVPVLGRGFTLALAGLLGATAAAALLAVGLTPARHYESQVPARAMDAAARIAARNPSLRILGDNFSGTTMLWLHPGLLGRVGFDARMEQYTRPELAAYFDFLFRSGPHWQRVTHGYGIIVASQLRPSFARALASLPGWHVAYRDRAGIVVVRDQR